MTTATLTSPLPRQTSVWRNISFLLMWSSVAASGFGDRLIQLAAQPLLGVEEATASAAKIQSGITFFFFLPYMGLTVFGGWIADRLPRKWIMLACDEGRALVLLLALVFTYQLTSSGMVSVDHHWKIYLIIAATGAFAAIFNPARQATVPQIVPTSQLQQANALLVGIGLIASLIGLGVGGWIIDSISTDTDPNKGIRTGILIGVLSFAISGTFFAFLKTPKRVSQPLAKRPGLVAQMLQAASYMRHHRAVTILVVLNVLFWAAAYVVYAAIAALVKSHYSAVPDDQYVIYSSAMLATLGGGMLCGSFFVLWLRTRRESGLVSMTTLLLAGLCMFALAFNRSYPIGVILAFLAGLLGGIFLVCVDTLTQSITPNYIRGRVFGLRSLLNTFFGVAVNLAIWQLPQQTADQLMIPALIVTASILSIAAAVSVWHQLTTGPVNTRMANAIWHINRLFVLVWHRLQWINRHNIPTSGSVIITANHTAGLDPFLIQAASPRMIRWVMLNSFKFKALNFLWKEINPIPVNQDGNDMTQLREMLRELKTDSLVGIFPEGGIQRGHRNLKPFEAGIGLIAKRSEAVIVPIWISGTPMTKHMLWHFLKPSKSIIIFGTPYRPDPEHDHQQIADDLRDRMLKLAEQINER